MLTEVSVEFYLNGAGRVKQLCDDVLVQLESDILKVGTARTTRAELALIICEAQRNFQVSHIHVFVNV